MKGWKTVKKAITRRTFAKATAVALAGTAAFGLAACIGGDPNKGGNGGSGESSGGNSGGNPGGHVDPVQPAAEPVSELVPFDNVFFDGNDTYVGIPSTFPFLEVEPTAEASMYWLDIPGTIPVKRADFFAIYKDKLYFTDFIHPTDAAARLTCLYVADKDGSNRRIVVDDVAATTKPVIVNGTLYYLSYIIDEGQEIYTYPSDNGGTTKAGDAQMCTSILKSYHLVTGVTKSVEIGRTIAGQFVGATTERLFVATDLRDNAAKVTSMELDFSDPQTFNAPGYTVGIDEAGHIITRAYGNSVYHWSVCDSQGGVLKSLTSEKYSAVFSACRYLIFEDERGALVIFDTVNMAQVKRMEKIDDWSSDRYYYYYDPGTDEAYFIGRHGTIPGIYKGWSNYGDYSVFKVESDGQVCRVLPYLDVLWRRSGAWDSPKGYVLQWIEIDFYTYEQLAQLTDEQLFHARQEIFYCHGYDFDKEMNDPELAAYYKKKTWPRELTNTPWSNAEKRNLAIIEQIEKDRKSPYEGRAYTLEYLEALP